jgi:hypothetical protein
VSRWRAAACAWAAGTTVFVAAGLPSRAADASPADTMLERARVAVATHEFQGEVRVGWRVDGRLESTDVPVRAVDGGLRLAQGALVEEGGRAWIRTQARWETLWADGRRPDVPSVEAKYRVRIAAGPAVAGRPTRTLVILHDHHVVERYDFDRALGIVLRRLRFDDHGRVTASMAFLRLGSVLDVHGTMKTPPLDDAAPHALTRPPDDARRRVGDGFVLLGAQRVGDETQLLYSDGVFTASVFSRDGVVDRHALPAGGADVRVGDVRVRRYRTAGGTVLTWAARGHTYTCVTDASDGDQRAMLASLRSAGDNAWTRAVRFVTGPFSWF